jgi:thiol-disulfide isomerase/thioredoxin
MRVNRVVLGLVFWIGFLGFQEVGFAFSDDVKKQALLVAFKAPDFDGQKNWVNSSGYKSMDELRGKVVLINLWTSSCQSCVQAFSHVQAWHETYKNKGLTVIGIHPPEFGTARDIEDLLWTAKKRGLTFPIVQDNGFKLWGKYGNRIWPAVFLIDKTGEVRYSHLGKGNYQTTESTIVKLLNE